MYKSEKVGPGKVGFDFVLDFFRLKSTKKRSTRSRSFLEIKHATCVFTVFSAYIVKVIKTGTLHIRQIECDSQSFSKTVCL